MKLRPRILNLSDPVEYLTPPNAAVQALRLGYREREPEGTEAEKPPSPKKKKKGSQ